MHDYTKEDMINALKAVGIMAGDTVLFYVSLGFLGRPEGVGSQEGLNRLFLECCQEVLGQSGTMLVPTYSYSFCRRERFDPRSTPTSLGPFPEFFRTLPQAERSVEPILAVSGVGPAASQLFRDLPPTSYGRGCIYERMVRAGVKICSVGLQMNWATFRHHIEEVEGVPFRYRKHFVGDLVMPDDRSERAIWTYSVRLWSPQADPDGHRLAHMLLEDGVSRSAQLGRGSLSCVTAQDYYAYAAEKFRSEPWLSARGPAANPIELEKIRAPHSSPFAETARPVDLDGLLRTLSGVRLAPVGDACAEALELVRDFAPLELRGYKSGDEHFGVLVPERWEGKSVEVVSTAGDTWISESGGQLRMVVGSRPFEGEVDSRLLLEHLYPMAGSGEEAGPGVDLAGLDWGIGCSPAFVGELAEGSYRVSVKADFSFGEMIVAELAGGGIRQDAMLVWATLANSGQDALASYDAVACLATMRRYLDLREDLGIQFVVAPDERGLLAWLSDHRAGSFGSVVRLSGLAGGGGVVMQPQGPLGDHLWQRLVHRTPGYALLPAEGLTASQELRIPCHALCARNGRKATMPSGPETFESVAEQVLHALLALRRGDSADSLGACGA